MNFFYYHKIKYSLVIGKFNIALLNNKCITQRFSRDIKNIVKNLSFDHLISSINTFEYINQ